MIFNNIIFVFYIEISSSATSIITQPVSTANEAGMNRKPHDLGGQLD